MRTVEDIVNDMNEIMAAAEGRSLTDAEGDRYDALTAEHAKARKDEIRRAHNAEMNAPAGAIPRAGSAKPKAEDSINAAFTAYLRTGQPNADIKHLQVIVNAQSESVASAGGYLVPTEFRKKLTDRMKAFGGIGNVVEQLDTTNGNPIEWPTLDDTANEGEIVNESGTFTTGADLVFGTVQLGAYKYATAGKNALPLRLPVELIQDSAFDIEKIVADKLGMRLARISARHLVTGTGVGQPNGLANRTPVQSAANTGFTYDDIIEWIHSVDPAYREGGACRWAWNDKSMAYFEKMKDSHGDPLWRPADANAAMDVTIKGTFAGFPVTIDQSFVDIDIDDSADVFGVFGDLREGYVRRRVKDVVVIANPYTRASYGEVEFSAWMRQDGQQQNTAAYVGISGKS